MASGDVSIGDPFLTSEEMLLLRELDPKYRTNLSLHQEELENISNESYKESEQYEDVGIVPRIPQGVNGGFAFSSLIPIIASLAPGLINLAVKGVTSIINNRKAKGKGVRAPNAGGAYPPNMRTRGSGDVKKYILSHMPEIVNEEDNIRKFRGKRFWREMLNMVQNKTADALTSIGLTPNGSGKLAEASVRKIFPRSFIDFIRKNDNSKTSGSGEKNPVSHFRSIVRTLCEWVISKAVRGKIDSKKLRELIDKQLQYIDTKYTGEKGVSDFWGKAKKIMKRVGIAVIPQLTSVDKQTLPIILNNIISKITPSDTKTVDWVKRANKVVSSAIDEVEGEGYLTDEMPYIAKLTRKGAPNHRNPRKAIMKSDVEDVFSSPPKGKGKKASITRNGEKKNFSIRIV
jgi:hypothetical protein